MCVLQQYFEMIICDMRLVVYLYAGICKQRSAASTTPEEFAMHRALSEHVASAFASQSISTIQSNMMRSALEVSARNKR